MPNTTKRDLKNIKILCDFWSGELDEDTAMSMLVLKQTSVKGKDKYLKKLIRTIRDEEQRIKALRSVTDGTKESN